MQQELFRTCTAIVLLIKPNLFGDVLVAVAVVFCLIKVLANEDTLLRTHCCQHKCFPVCPRAQYLLRAQILCPDTKNVSDFVQKHFVSATNVSQFAQPKKHHEQHCVRNNVSSFASHLICIFYTFFKLKYLRN